jgi:hypothetical protein
MPIQPPPDKSDDLAPLPIVRDGIVGKVIAAHKEPMSDPGVLDLPPEVAKPPAKGVQRSTRKKEP